MRRVHRHFVSILFMLLATAIASTAKGEVAATPVSKRCSSLRNLADTDADASPGIASCLGQLPKYSTLRLDSGNYHLRSPLSINQPVTIESSSTSSGSACRNGDSAHCAVLVIDQMPAQPVRGLMPVEITAPNVELRRLAIVGSSKRSAQWEKQVCLDEHARPLGGGIRVRSDGFRLESVLIRNVSCYSALELVVGVAHPSIRNSIVGPNGSHNLPQMWADGVTVQNSSGAHIEDNLFLDNTDVQLIFGGCRNCIVSHNMFRHSPAFRHASFAELMLHAWPNTSGDFTGSTISRNDIDCGPARECGYGIMIGGEPWYPARTFGGRVTSNRVSHALIALNVDKLTGSMVIVGTTVSASGGEAYSDCGSKVWPAINISPKSIDLVQTDAKYFGSMDTSKCLFLHDK
jgi:hypothetical protein